MEHDVHAFIKRFEAQLPTGEFYKIRDGLLGEIYLKLRDEDVLLNFSNEGSVNLIGDSNKKSSR